MKSLASIALLLTFLLPFAVPFTVLEMQRKVVKKKVKWMMIAGIEEAQLVHLNFSKEKAAQLDWKHSAEFAYRGEMYDIVRSIDHGNSITYVCWHDHEETILSKDLDRLIANYLKHAPESNHTKARTAWFLKTLTIHALQKVAPLANASNRQVENQKPYLVKPYCAYLDCLVPPPDVM